MSELIYDKWGNPVDTTFANADSVSQGSNVLGTAGFNYGFNPMTAAWDRLRSGGNNADGIATSSAGIQSHNAFNLIYNGSTYDRQLSAYNMMNGMSGKGMAANTNMAYNGATYDNVYNNNQGTLLASSTRTATTNAPVQTNYNARGVILFLNVSAASGTGGIHIVIKANDPTSGAAPWMAPESGAVTAVGNTMYAMYPGIPSGGAITGTGFSQTTNMVLPRTWYASVYHDDASSYTYSLGYAYIL